ncbi:MAG: hypothetical protein K0S45_374 [Nitrospira sp.]|jgi:hypothetical protein|nr:hypothetical protein [Nitrospira sp.]
MLAGGCAEGKSRAQLEREWFECGLAAGQGAREQGRAHDVFAVQGAQDGCFAVKNPTHAYRGVVIQGGYERGDRSHEKTD